MIKKIHICFFTILLSLLTIFSMFTFSSNSILTAKAISSENVSFEEKPPLEDNIFQAENGARLGTQTFGNEGYQLKFVFYGFDEYYNNLMNLSNGDYTTWNNKLAPDTFAHRFTLYRKNDDELGTATKLQSVAFLYSYAYYNNRVVLLEQAFSKNFTRFDEGFNVVIGREYASDLHEYDFTGTTSDGYVGMFKNYLSSTDFSVFSVDVTFDSPYSEYYVEFEYEYKTRVKDGFWTGVKLGVLAEGKISSVSRSVYSIFQKMDSVDTLEEELSPYEGYLEHAQNLLTGTETKTVTVKYLEQIGDTPFATHVYKNLTVPVCNNVIRYDDVCAILGLPTVDCLGSHCYSFVYNAETNNYDAYYLKDFWVRAMTEEGFYVDYFFDINQSYYDYFYQFVDANVFSEDLFEFIFSVKIYDNYPELANYKFEELYGFYGLVAVPQSHSLDSLFCSLMDIDKTIQGQITLFSYKDTISYDSYIKLKQDYGFSWVSQAWDTVFGATYGTYSANYYLFYAEPNTSESFIGEGGQEDAEDTQGAIDKGLSEGIEDIGNYFGSLIGNNTLGKLISVVLVVGILFGVFYLLKGLFRNNKRR